MRNTHKKKEEEPDIRSRATVSRAIFIRFDFPQSYWIHDALSLWKTKPCFFCCELSYDSLGWGLGPFVRNDATRGEKYIHMQGLYTTDLLDKYRLRRFSWSSLLRCSLCHQKASIIDFEPSDLPFHEDAIFTSTS